MDNPPNLHLESQQAHQPNFAGQDPRATKLREHEADKRINHSAAGMSLPCQADRHRVMEQAKLVLAEARVVAEQSDRIHGLLAPARPVERTPQPLSFALAEALNPFPT